MRRRPSKRHMPMLSRLYALRLLAAGAAVAALVAAGGQAASASTGSPPTLPPVPVSSQPTTTTTTAPAAPSSSGNPSPASGTGSQSRSPATTAPKGKPKVPVGGPPTTSLPPGTPAPPPPDPKPILSAVDEDLDQLQAIADYKPAQNLVAEAQAAVVQAGSALQSARTVVSEADAQEAAAGQRKDSADAQLRQLAVAAYIGVGYETPGIGEPAAGNGNQGFGTVSTPAGLTGIQAADAREMLLLVGERARDRADQAARAATDAAEAATAARSAYKKAQVAAAGAENRLLAAQQTLKLVTAAALTPGTAAATTLPVLASISGQGGAGAAQPASAPITSSQPGTSTTVPATKASVPPAAAGAQSGAGSLATVAEANPPITISNPTSPTVLGPAVLDASELAGWYASTGQHPNITVPMSQLTQYYAAWGAKTGVRDDVAFAQSVVETGYFTFPAGGQLTGQDNNFAGIGACDTCAHGWSFPNASNGVGAQMELLDAYASPHPVDTSLVGSVGVGGCCSTWTALAGTWASSLTYGISIMTVYDQMLKWAIPERLQQAGLIGTSQQAAAQGPELAPLPPGPTKPASSTAGAGQVH
jgi:hypothetical protein